MSDKVYVSANDLARDSFKLARRIYDSEFRPDVLLVLWRGGTPVGIIIHEFLLYKGIHTYHTAIKSTSYTGIEERIEPTVENMEPVLEMLSPDSRVLVVDDIFDTGSTIRKVNAYLTTRTPHVKTATLYYKPEKNITHLTPDYYLHKTDGWIVFPHELIGLSQEEIRCKNGDLYDIIQD